ncbi:MAG TPA: hypothetical protein VGK80_06805 [Rhodanobacteraceae bacterium]
MLAHVLDEFESGQARMAPLEIGHEFRQYTDHLPAFRQRTIRHRAHRTGGAAAVHERALRVGQQLTQSKCGNTIALIGLLAGSGVDADAHGNLVRSSEYSQPALLENKTPAQGRRLLMSRIKLTASSN